MFILLVVVRQILVMFKNACDPSGKLLQEYHYGGIWDHTTSPGAQLVGEDGKTTFECQDDTGQWEVPPPSCQVPGCNSCGDNGNCSNNKCVCDPGYTGDCCQTSQCQACTGACQVQNCIAGQTCKEAGYTYSCLPCGDNQWSSPSPEGEGWGTGGLCRDCSISGPGNCAVNVDGNTVQAPDDNANACLVNGGYTTGKAYICFNGKLVYESKSGYPCSNDNECADDHVCAYWNDKVPGYKKERCCPSSHWMNNWAAAWCTQLSPGDPCLDNGQCTSGKCSPGNTADSVCDEN